MFLDNKSILITGGTGSIGSSLAKQLLNYNVDKVIVFSRDETKQFLMSKEIIDPRFQTVLGDVRDYPSLKKTYEKYNADLIYNIAAMKHVTMSEKFPLEAVKTNILGTNNLICLAKNHNITKLINIGTDKAVYPTSVMGASKFIAERMIINSGYTSIRLGNVAGSRGSVIPVLLKEMQSQKQITITDLDVTRFIMTIEDAIRLILKATEISQGEDIFILKMKTFKLKKIIPILINDVCPKIGLNHKSIKIKIIGTVKGEKVHEQLITREETRKLYELPNLYYLTENKKQAELINAKKAMIEIYDSSNSELIPDKELKEIIYTILRKDWQPYSLNEF